MGYTAKAANRQEQHHHDNDDTPSREKMYILPSGEEGFIRSDGIGKRKRKRLSHKRKEWPAGKVISVANLYLSDIRKTIAGRHGGPCDTDEGEIYLAAALPILILRFETMKHDGRNPKPVDSHAWAWKHARKLAEERPQAWFREMEQRLITELNLNPAPLPSADQLAQDLQITHAEVIAFKLRSVGAVDRLAPQRHAEEKVKRASRERERRAKEKTIPHSESMAQTKPWEAYNVSEPTFRRWVRQGKVPPHPTQRKARTANG